MNPARKSWVLLCFYDFWFSMLLHDWCMAWPVCVTCMSGHECRWSTSLCIEFKAIIGRLEQGWFRFSAYILGAHCEYTWLECAMTGSHQEPGLPVLVQKHKTVQTNLNCTGCQEACDRQFLGWKGGPTVSACWSCKGPRFSSQTSYVLTTAFNSSSRGSNAFFWPLNTKHTWDSQTFMQAYTHTHKIENK